MMRLRRLKVALILTLVGLLLVACGDDGGDSSPSEDTPPGTSALGEDGGPIPADTTLSPVLVHLQRDYEALLTAQETIATIWDNLATGEQVQCGDYPDVFPPEDVSDEGDLAYENLVATLRSAAIEIERAVNLWQTECLNPRANPPPDVINEGRLASRAAGDALREAEAMLGAIQ